MLQICGALVCALPQVKRRKAGETLANLSSLANGLQAAAEEIAARAAPKPRASLSTKRSESRVIIACAPAAAPLKQFKALLCFPQAMTAARVIPVTAVLEALKRC